MKMSKTILAMALLVVLLGSVIPETGAVDRQPAPHGLLLAAPLHYMHSFRTVYDYLLHLLAGRGSDQSLVMYKS